MSKTPFRARIRRGTPLVGTLVTLDSPEVAEVLSSSGFDWLFIDMEHGPLDIAAAQDLIRATIGDCLALVRIPENSDVWIKRVLDAGCDGIIVPQVCSAAEAHRAATAARYPPVGRRGVGIGRAHGYGLRVTEYIEEANDRVAVIVQIEHVTALSELDEILQVDGVDGVLIGPYDLSGSMHRLGDVKHPDVQGAIASIREACARRGMPTGIFVLDPDDVPAHVEAGSAFLAVGTDMSFIIGGARRALQSVERRLYNEE